MNADTVIALLGLGLVMLSTAAAALIWFVRLEGKVETLRALHEQHKEMVDKAHADFGHRLDRGLQEVKDAVNKVFDRLETKQDKR